MIGKTDATQRTSVAEYSLNDALPQSLCERIDDTRSLPDGVPTSDSPGSKAPSNFELQRFRILEVLGEGGYGCVYKAFDDQLQRYVAIKVPHLFRMTSPEAITKYLDEARTLAKVEHPNIVAVYDVGVNPAGIPYIVSALIDGTNLARKMKDSPLTLGHALELIITIARALGFVHSRGIVHRDIKPGNILLDVDGKPFLADFGLALSDVERSVTRNRAGTPQYMSPEQARGENHLVDGRSDIFSLGIILYEMLTGKRPFSGSNRDTVLQNLLTQEVQPVRQISASVPRDLERICLKMLAKRSSDRYRTTAELIEDLEHFLTNCDSSGQQAKQVEPSVNPSSEIGGVIPRGLRSYDRHDAGFFTRLLPGPRDRQWVPESLRFWQRQIEAEDPLDPPRVGVIYGPSGCGKSSFVKAGLLPLLSDGIETVFIEATHQDTESRLLRGIRKHFRQVDPQADLVGTLAQIRNTPSLLGGRRLLIVIDQFEQWLHSRVEVDPSQADPELAQALRQCDGNAIVCLLLVRDDFWLALSRFMAVLEVLIEQNKNAMLVDLFTVSHARNVLHEFGVAYHRLPEDRRMLSPEQNRFLDAATKQLSVAGKVFPVRLALFVEMVKGQPWTIETLDSLGGVEGIGLQFLEESFSSNLAPVAQSTHEPAVRRVLRELLPETGVDIKGNMRSEAVLLEASGYQSRLNLFDEMMRILDTDLRLVTPTDPAGTMVNEDSLSQSGEGARFYQLTHDFLVPAIDQWLTKKQRATRQGRAELRLAEYASLWSAKPIAKNAPSWLDWVTFKLWTSPTRYSATERDMMKFAGRRHTQRTTAVAALLAMMFFGSWWLLRRNTISTHVLQLQTARTEELPNLLATLRSFGKSSISPLNHALTSTEPSSRGEFVSRMALMPHDRSLRRTLLHSAVESDLAMLEVLQGELHPLEPSERGWLVDVLTQNESPDPQRLRAAILLAGEQSTLSDDENASLRSQAEAIVAEMLRHSTNAPQDNRILITSLKPIVDHLNAPLQNIALQAKASPSRLLANSLLTQLLRDSPEPLLAFFLDASIEQQSVILPTLDQHLASITDPIRSIAFQDIDTALPEPQYEKLAKRSATAAGLLHRLGQPESTWPLLEHTPWPHRRSYLIHRIAALGGEFELVLNRYLRESNVSIRRALLMAMGEYSWDQLEPAIQKQTLSVIKDSFLNDPDTGIHSTAYWFLLQTGNSDWLEESIKQLSATPADPRKNWYVTPEGQTMAVIDARNEPSIGYVYEISAGEVTIEQFLRYDPNHLYRPERSPEPKCPANTTNWLNCAGYCRWLSERLNAAPDQSYPDELSETTPDVPYQDMIKHGSYRLPTSREWTYACAAGTTSYRYFGFSDELADKYYQYFETATPTPGLTIYSPAGKLKPNDFGMFNMYDGIREWCHDSPPGSSRRYVFGASSNSDIGIAKTIDDSADLHNAVNGYYGLRIARTAVTRN